VLASSKAAHASGQIAAVLSLAKWYRMLSARIPGLITRVFPPDNQDKEIA
jgi:hypothetical protein